MFDLNQTINRFRDELVACQSMNEPDVNELMAHLKDGMHDLREKGLSEEESFWIARHRLGDARALSIEFSKVNPSLVWKRRILSLLAGYYLFALIPKLVHILTIPLCSPDFKWMHIRIPVLSPDYAAPVPAYIVILITAGWIFYKLSRRKTASGFNAAAGSRPGTGFMISLILLFWISNLGIMFLKFYLSNHSPDLLGEVMVSGSIFSLLWNFFLLVMFIIITGTLIFAQDHGGFNKKHQVCLTPQNRS
ncbi:hypothetical protein JW948_14370 [bacterium]|nr:hypothetical protein [bacterium]